MNNTAITAKNISKKVQKKVLLQDVNFTIESGTLTSLIGPNGAGKSTLVKIILGIDTASSNKLSRITINSLFQYKNIFL